MAPARAHIAVILAVGNVLLPDETAKIRWHLSRTPVHMTIVAAIALVCAITPSLIYLPTEGRVDHLLGRDQAVIATVDDVVDIGGCGRSGGTEYRIEVSWILDEQPGNGSYTDCGAHPRRGSKTEVWVGPSGHVENNSPTYDRIGLSSVSLMLAAMVLGIGFWVVQARRRSFQRLLAQAHSSLSPALPVAVQRGYKNRLYIAHQAPHMMGTYAKVRIEVLLVNAKGTVTTVGQPRALAGSWWLHLVHANDPRYQIGLLGRGNERSWVQFRRP